jgi:uncharacterized protein
VTDQLGALLVATFGKYKATVDRLAPTRPPNRAFQGFQRWHRLLFVHWEVPVSVLRPLVDPRLTIDTFDGRAFVGLVAFTMLRVRPFRWFPSFPTATNFGEINLRTYVHLDGREPGVCFFSLDAQSSLVTLAARALWHLPYFRSDFVHHDDGQQVRWRSKRRWPRPAAQPFEASFSIGEPVRQPVEGSLEFFLAERYQFYTPSGRSLLRARVAHAPYALHHAHDVQVGTSLLDAAGLPSTGPRTPDYFSPGVDVQVYSMERAA